MDALDKMWFAGHKAGYTDALGEVWSAAANAQTDLAVRQVLIDLAERIRAQYQKSADYYSRNDD